MPSTHVVKAYAVVGSNNPCVSFTFCFGVMCVCMHDSKAYTLQFSIITQ